jgi:hypothetical protein
VNTVNVYVKQGGNYELVQGTVADFTSSDRLDEQLEEARLIIANSPVENYPPTTEFMIEFLVDGEPKRRLYIISGEPKANQFNEMGN